MKKTTSTDREQRYNETSLAQLAEARAAHERYRASLPDVGLTAADCDVMSVHYSLLRLAQRACELAMGDCDTVTVADLAGASDFLDIMDRCDVNNVRHRVFGVVSRLVRGAVQQHASARRDACRFAVRELCETIKHYPFETKETV